MFPRIKNIIYKFLTIHNILPSHKKKFKSGDYYYYNGIRPTFEKSLPLINSSGRALDIGAGFGNETKTLLKMGFEVVATEINFKATRYLEKLAKRSDSSRRALEVYNVQLPDIPKGKFDLIVCEMVLHFMSKNEVLASIQNIQSSTSNRGLNVISSYIDSKSIHQDVRLAGYFSYLLKSGELQKLYSDWDILYAEEKSNMLGHQSVRLITRKK